MTTISSYDLNTLFKRARAGDASSLNEFCRIIRGGLIEIATYRMPGWSREVIEDIVHDTLTIFLQKVTEVNGSPTAYVRGILYNRIGNELQRSTPVLPVELDGHQPNEFDHQASSPARFVQEVENRDTIEKCASSIRSMGEPCRTLLLGILEGRSVGEIWKGFRTIHPEMNRSAFDRRLYLCRRRLLKLMGVNL